MKTIPPVLSILALSLLCASASAGPAPWYKWRSRLDGAVACSQTPLGQGWDQLAGAYKDSRCEKPVVAKMLVK
jgi:hypothetical protein